MLNKKVMFLAGLPGDSGSNDGYINAAEGIRRILLSLNIKDLKIVNLSIPFNEKEIPDHEYDVAYLICNPFMFPQQQFQQTINRFLEKAKKIYIQIVWETSTFPMHWQWMWGFPGFSGFIAPSFFVENMINLRTKKPTFYIPHCIDLDSFKQIDIEKKAQEEKFTVLHIGQWTERKGNKDALIAFCRALGEKADCQLIMKYQPMGQAEINPEAMIKSIVQRNAIALRANIFVNSENNTVADLVKLYHSTSVLLFCSRGEGFGLPAAETMSCGIPVIYTEFSSMPEVCESPANVSIPCFEDEAHGMMHFGYEKGLKYGIPKMTDLVVMLEKQYNLWKIDKKAYYEKSIQNRQLIEQKYSKVSVQEKMLNFINNC
jgi:glycosyltransferase involved in cell wall biosynthesis